MPFPLRHVAPAGLVLLLAGCATAQVPTGAEDTCGAAGYRSLIGKNIAAVTLPADAPIRILGPDSMATMDFRPDRLNIETDRGGYILRLRCG
ncbi:I78 family peptidase inhibitor [Roseivivax sp. CAU 1761]